MSWTRNLFDNDMLVKVNFTSGYWAQDQLEEDYGLFEKEISLTNPTSDGYITPSLAYWTVSLGMHGSVAPNYQRQRTAFYVIGYPNINSEYGYFCSQASENPWKAMFKAGFQHHIYLYNSDDSFFGTRSNTDITIDGFDGDPRVYLGGMPDEMQQFIDFYKNGYAEASFMTIFDLRYIAGAYMDEDREDFIQVPYHREMANMHLWSDYVFDTDNSIIFAK